MRQEDTPDVAARERASGIRSEPAGPPARHPGPVAVFPSAETRADDMQATVETWLGELAALVEDARSSEVFRDWLDVQSRFHEYSYRNTLLILAQRPSATRVAGYRTWQTEFDRQVGAGERAIWIWAPIIARRCPTCEHSQRYHEARGCTFDETPPDDWPKGVVAFKPVPVFDVAQTEGAPLPELATAATGDGCDLLERSLEAAVALGIEARLVPAAHWPYGEADGVCLPPASTAGRPRVEIRRKTDAAAMAGTTIHEFAHARLHGDVDDDRPKREVEAEAVAYLVGRYFGLDTSNSAFYLAAWQGEDTGTLGRRLGRISRTATELIESIEAAR